MYKVNDEVKTLEEVLEMIEENMDYEEYDEMLDEVLEPWTTGTLTYYPSYILKKCDPVAYRCGFLEYVDSELYGSIKYELERMSDGEELEFYGVTIEFTDDEEEDEEDEEDEEEDSSK